MALDVVYYLNFEEIAYLAKEGLTAACINFTKFYGYLPNNNLPHEAQYELDVEGKVSMVVKGSNNGYNHDACLWTTRTNGVNLASKTLTWKVYKVTDVFVYLDFYVGKAGLPISPVPELYSTSLDQIRNKDVNVSHEIRPYEFDDERKYNICGYPFYAKQGKRTIYLPTAIVLLLRMHRFNRKFDNDVCNTMIAEANNLLRKSNLPMKQVNDIMPWLIRVAALYGVQDEERALDTLHSNRRFTILPANFAPFKATLVYMGCICLLGGMTIIVIHFSLLSSVWVLLVDVLLFFLGTFILALVLLYVTPVIRKASIIDTVLRFNRQQGGIVDYRTPLLAPVEKLAMPMYHSDIDKLPVTDLQQMTMEIMPLNYNDPNGSMLISVGFINAIPSVPASDMTNELIAIEQRLIGDQTQIFNRLNVIPPPENNIWLQASNTALNDKLFEGIDTEFFKTYDRSVVYLAWNERFNPSKQAKHNAAYQKYDDPAKFTDAEFKVSSFVKVELNNKWDFGFGKEYKPRAIQQLKDSIKVFAGPYFWKFSSELSRIWNSEHFMYYPSGSSADQVGKWFVDSVDFVNSSGGDLKFIKNDFSSFDATISTSALQAEINIYASLGAPDYIAYIKEKQFSTQGYTTKGGRFKFIGRRLSGMADTTVSNSIDNAVVTYAALKQQFKPDIIRQSTRMIFLGDDSLMITTLPLDLEKYQNKLGEFGLKANVEVCNRHTAMFCSQYFWPHETGVSLGPSPARALSRIGWTAKAFANAKRERFIKGDMLGIRAMASCVPVLTHLVEILLSRVNNIHNPLTHNFQSINNWQVSDEKKINYDTWCMFTEITGVQKHQALQLVDYFKAIKIPCLINHPVATQILACQ
jgi:hypothetical protein